MRGPRGVRTLLPFLLLAVSACVVENGQGASSNASGTGPDAKAGAGSEQASRGNATAEEAPTPPLRPPQTPAQEQLQDRLAQLGSGFGGDVGIAVRDLGAGWTAHFEGTELYPQQSVSKIWVAITALDQVDQGKLDLSQQVTLSRDDLTLFYQPIRGLVLRDGKYRTTLDDLLSRAIARSDNTANDVLLRTVGGPEAIRRTLAQKGLDGIRFGPGEREMQSKIAGLEWKPEYSVKRNFFEARDEVPATRRRAAFEAYLENPVDGAAPVAIADALAKLRKGELLSEASTQKLLSIMEETRSGPRRLKGGLAPGWSISHKTGTGQEYGGAQAGYNDVGLLTSPSGRSYSIAVLMGRTRQPIPERMQLMQKAVQAVTEYDEKVGLAQ